MRNLMALLAGGVFGAGLFTSGMTDTTKVQGWLDVFGEWDPTLAFVMGGAILPMFFAWRIAARMKVSRLGTPFPTPRTDALTPNLIIGSTMFGAGWGLTGLCPGPAMAALSYGGAGGLIFLASMVAGMVIARPIKPLLEQRTPEIA